MTYLQPSVIKLYKSSVYILKVYLSIRNLKSVLSLLYLRLN